MSLTFYFAPNSTANVTAAILAELEHSLHKPIADSIELSISAGDTRKPEYLSSVNPNGRVPAIVHEGVPIWESAAITVYLGETFGVSKNGDEDKPSLYPAPGPQRGEAMKWIVWTNTTLTPGGQKLAASMPFGTPGGVEEGSQDVMLADKKARHETAEKARKDIAVVLGILDGALKEKDYLLGNLYCLADTHVWAFVSWLTIMGVSTAMYPNVKGWVARVGERPALKDL